MWISLPSHGRSPSLVFRAQMAVEVELVPHAPASAGLCFRHANTVALQLQKRVLLQPATVSWTPSHTLRIACMTCVLPMGTRMFYATAWPPMPSAATRLEWTLKTGEHLRSVVSYERFSFKYYQYSFLVHSSINSFDLGWIFSYEMPSQQSLCSVRRPLLSILRWPHWHYPMCQRLHRRLWMWCRLSIQWGKMR